MQRFALFQVPNVLQYVSQRSQQTKAVKSFKSALKLANVQKAHWVYLSAASSSPYKEKNIKLNKEKHIKYAYKLFLSST